MFFVLRMLSTMFSHFHSSFFIFFILHALLFSYTLFHMSTCDSRQYKSTKHVYCFLEGSMFYVLSKVPIPRFVLCPPMPWGQTHGKTTCWESEQPRVTWVPFSRVTAQGFWTMTSIPWQSTLSWFLTSRLCVFPFLVQACVTISDQGFLWAWLATYHY